MLSSPDAICRAGTLTGNAPVDHICRLFLHARFRLDKMARRIRDVSAYWSHGSCQALQPWANDHLALIQIECGYPVFYQCFLVPGMGVGNVGADAG